jgi:hypothetical protein
MAFRLPHGLKDPLRQALLSQSTGVGPGVGPDGFDHGGAFADALCILCGRFPRDGNHGKHEQQGLHDRAISNRSTLRVDRLRATSGFDRSAVKRNTLSGDDRNASQRRLDDHFAASPRRARSPGF